MEISQVVSHRMDYSKPILFLCFLYFSLLFLASSVQAVTVSDSLLASKDTAFHGPILVQLPKKRSPDLSDVQPRAFKTHQDREILLADIEQQSVQPRIRSDLGTVRPIIRPNPRDIPSFYIPKDTPEFYIPPPSPIRRPYDPPDPTPTTTPFKPVPNLLGFCSDQAIRMLEQAGMTPYQVTPPRLSHEPTGKIISQTPQPGSNFVPRLTTVTITPSEQRAASLSLQITGDRLWPGETTRLTAVIDPPWPLGSASFRLLRDGKVVAQNNNGVFQQAMHSPGTYRYQAEATLGPSACGQMPRTRILRSRTIPVIVQAVASPPTHPLPLPPTPPPPSPGPSMPTPPQTGIPFGILIVTIIGLLLLVIVIRLFRKQVPGTEEENQQGESDDLKIVLEQGLRDMEVDQKGSGNGLDYILALRTGDLTVKPKKVHLRVKEIYDD